MAQINDVIDELNTIATAFGKTFIFDEIGYINEEKNKTYPAILVDSRNIDINVLTFNRSNLPQNVDYTLRMFFLDTYFQSQQKTTTRQTKYAAMETIANQYLAEVKRRTESLAKGFHLRSSTVSNGFVVDKVHNDDLVQLVYSVTFRADNDCQTGTFTYA